MDKALELFITVYDDKYNYMVVIGTDVYEMSTDAHAPNGVNMYSGTLAEHDFSDVKKIPLSELTESTKLAIADRIYLDVLYSQNSEEPETTMLSEQKPISELTMVCQFENYAIDHIKQFNAIPCEFEASDGTVLNDADCWGYAEILRL